MWCDLPKAVSKLFFRHAARWQKPNPTDPTQLLGPAILSAGGYRHDRNWVFWTFLIEVGYLVLLVFCTAIALKILNREPSSQSLPAYPASKALDICGAFRM